MAEGTAVKQTEPPASEEERLQRRVSFLEQELSTITELKRRGDMKMQQLKLSINTQNRLRAKAEDALRELQKKHTQLLGYTS